MTIYTYPTLTTNVSDTFTDHVNRGSVNPGTDYTAAYGSAVYAVASGTVTDADNTNGGGGGRTIHIDHDDGSGSDYLHLSACQVPAGRWVAQGTQIGVSGASGNGSNWWYGPHLHISFRYNHAHGYGNSGNVDFDAVMSAQGPAPTPTPDPTGEDMSNIIHRPDGSLALAATDGSFTVLTDMDQVNSLIAAGVVPRDENQWVWLQDNLIWDKLQQVASRRSSTNNPTPAPPTSTRTSTSVSTAQWVIGGAGLLLILLALIAVPLIIANVPGAASTDLVSLEKFLIAGGLAFLGVAAGTITRTQVQAARHVAEGTPETPPTPIYRPGTQPTIGHENDREPAAA